MFNPIVYAVQSVNIPRDDQIPQSLFGKKSLPDVERIMPIIREEVRMLHRVKVNGQDTQAYGDEVVNPLEQQGLAELPHLDDEMRRAEHAREQSKVEQLRRVERHWVRRLVPHHHAAIVHEEHEEEAGNAEVTYDGRQHAANEVSHLVRTLAGQVGQHKVQDLKRKKQLRNILLQKYSS